MSACKCGQPSVYLARYSGEHLCAEHFCHSVEKRVRRELRHQGPFKRGVHIAIGLSGGKDSVVTLRLLHETFGKNPQVELTAVTVDEGIEGYRPESIHIAAAHCKELGIAHHILSYEETAGITMDRVAAIPLTANAPPASKTDAPTPAAAGGLTRRHMPCAYCGVMRRRNLNESARMSGATHVATGHNLDDVAQSILMNHLKGDIDRLARMGPHKREHIRDGLIPRILPLRLIPEKEVALYAILRGWEFHDGECPYSVEATRGRYRDLLNDLEDKEPGTRHSLLAGYDRLAPLLRGTMGPLGACDQCGEPTSGDTCRACALLAEVGGKPRPLIPIIPRQALE